MWLRICLTGVMAIGFLHTLPVSEAEARCSDRPEAGLDWAGCNKRNKKFPGKDLSGSKLVGTDFTFATLRDANLSGSDMQRAVLVKTSLSSAKLGKTNLTKAQGMRASFKEADLSDANLTKSEMSRASFQGASLKGANLTKSDFPRVVFNGADLSGADLSFSNVSRADFWDSNLSGVSFKGAYTLLSRFEGVDLSQAKGLTADQLDLACGDDKTKLPAGLSASAEWPCQ